MEILGPLALLGLGIVCGAAYMEGRARAAYQRGVVAGTDAGRAAGYGAGYAAGRQTLDLTLYTASGWTQHGGRAGAMPPATYYSLEMHHE